MTGLLSLQVCDGLQDTGNARLPRGGVRLERRPGNVIGTACCQREAGFHPSQDNKGQSVVRLYAAIGNEGIGAGTILKFNMRMVLYSLYFLPS